MKKKLNYRYFDLYKKGFIPFLLVLLILVSFYPYEFFSAYPFLVLSGSNIRTSQIILFFIIICISFFFRHTHEKLPELLIIMVVIHCFWWMINSLLKGKEFGLGSFSAPLLAIGLVYFINSTCGLKAFFINIIFGFC